MVVAPAIMVSPVSGVGARGVRMGAVLVVVVGTALARFAAALTLALA